MYASMIRASFWIGAGSLLILAAPVIGADKPVGLLRRHTEVAIRREQFFINGKPTYEGRKWNGKKIEGLLMNARIVQGDKVVRASDFLLLHGNGQNRPEQIVTLIRKTRSVPGYRSMPVLINEDDHYDFDQAQNNLTAAVNEYVSWGFFDYRHRGDGFDEGFQSPPANWGLSSARKKAFFTKIGEITGTRP
jgi:hypothetical protein